MNIKQKHVPDIYIQKTDKHYPSFITHNLWPESTHL